MTEGGAHESYHALEPRFRRLALLGEASGMLGWDWATMMPSASAPSRVDQLAELSLIAHEKATDPALTDLLDAAEKDVEGLGVWQRANLRAMRRDWRHANAVPADLVQALTRAGAACEMRWREARPANDFAGLLPAFRELVGLVRRVADAKGRAFGCSPYDALLDTFEPGGRIADIEPVFDDLARFLPDFVGTVLEHQAGRAPPLAVKGPFPVDRQRALGERMMKTLGFPFDQGRLDVSHHPFSGGTPEDLRITTRYDAADFLPGLMGVLHETGHALYEYGLPKIWRRQPVGEAAGMSIHESQSLLIEMQACRSHEFLSYAAPIIAETFGLRDPALSADNLHALATRVERGLIRVDSDEVTYPAHVILRTRLERAIIAGDLDPGDVPGAWNDAMQELVGVRPPDDRDGCLQDIHWYDGAFGYFPTYTLGAMNAAQLFDAATRADPGIRPALARGDFRPLYAWLRPNVHEKASLLAPGDLIEQATGRPLDDTVFKAHLRARYLEQDSLA